jgi:hypothetical protein
MPSGSKGSSSSTTIPTLSPAQNAMINAQTEFFTGTEAPSVQNAICGATKMYNNSVGGVNNAAQNFAGTSAQAQKTFGETGCSALRTGICGLENVNSPAYQQQQLQAALQPAEAQYAQNIAAQGAQFGGAGELGSERAAIAAQQTAGQTQAAQMNAAAGVMNNLAQQQLTANQALVGAGQTGLNSAQTSAQNQITAAMAPQQLYNQYASILFGTPSGVYSPNFSGTQGQTTNGSNYNAGIKI